MRKNKLSWQGVLGSLVAGLTLFRFVSVVALPLTQPVIMKLQGAGVGCPWPRVLTSVRDNTRFGELMDSLGSRLSVTAKDEGLGIEKITGLKREFWLRSQGDRLDGMQLIAYLNAEIAWYLEKYSEYSVREGDIVVDCGAHVGVFTNLALERGAAKVIAIEPEPVNLECFRRNFSRELAEGRVILVPKGVWSSAGSMTLSLGLSNSGTASVVLKDVGGVSGEVTIAVEPLDTIVENLKLPRVDFIKMDIEGAEREALKGASGILKRFRPRLMLDSYHLPDDSVVLPALIRSAHSDYELICGPCELAGSQMVPHVTFYR